MKIKKIGLLAGKGDLPARIADDCRKKGIEVFIIGFEGQTDPELVMGYPYLWTHLGAAGEVINALKEKNISDIVMAGAIKRPAFFDLRPDLKAAQILSRIGFRALGDNTLMSALRKELEAEGFTLHGVQAFSSHLLAPEGPIGMHAPGTEFQDDIDLGIRISQEIGRLDIGQSVVVQAGLVLGVEGVEGTDALISRCAALKKAEKTQPVLIKTCKPQQDMDIDLPTIGPETVVALHKAGFAGAAIHAGHSIILDAKAVAHSADTYRIFIVGVRI